MSILFYLVRHGLTDLVGNSIAGRAPGVHLNALGVDQAKRVASVLATRSVAVVCSSPLERARETAQPLCSKTKLRLEVRESFNELDFGRWTLARLSDLERDPGWAVWNRQRSTARAPGGESMVEAQARTLEGIRELYSRKPDGAVVVFSHADVIKCAVMHYLGMSLDRFWSFDIAPASITTVAVEHWGGRVVSLNVV